ncbi:MAG: hypothetical protein LBM69_03985 [Lachnospiraceae bacterium]|nr:hypothetical protein [Lachnospiraceae bacterium]
MDNEKETQLIRNRFRELAQKCHERNIYTYTSFLGQMEQDLFHRMEKELSFVSWEMWGGMEDATRIIIRFGSEHDLGYEEPYPIVCLLISAKNDKFADALSHRDFLGALMNVGIERTTLGDIVVGEKEAYLFCLETVADFITEQLRKVRHTDVACTRTTVTDNLPKSEPVEEFYAVASERSDAIISKIYHLSRSDVQKLYTQGRVLCNGRILESSSKMLKNFDQVTVRGFGKFIYCGISRETKKGKISVCVKRYLAK